MKKRLRSAVVGGSISLCGMTGAAAWQPWQNVVSVLVGSVVMAVVLWILYRCTDSDTRRHQAEFGRLHWFLRHEERRRR
ncbi:hypothetical protein ACTWJ8_31830 [Streptomyces sp. SDT5-1]|uniref:hypothetical protein n=1 Tax=Streptomyces sp. SDT5-1 TaxID=3406418 RepID=UPI003FD2AC5F